MTIEDEGNDGLSEATGISAKSLRNFYKVCG